MDAESKSRRRSFASMDSLPTVLLPGKDCRTALWLRSSQSGWPICTARDADTASNSASAGTGQREEFARLRGFILRGIRA